MIHLQTSEAWIAAYDQRDDLKSFGSAGLALFALALEFGYDDLSTIAADAIVDGPDDKGCDLVFLDKEKGALIVAQSYFSISEKKEARASKASDLRQAVSWLIEVDLATVPERLVASAQVIRSALANGEIEVVHLWFVHNCKASKNIKNELTAVEQTANSIIRTSFSQCKPRITAKEISSEIFEVLYSETSTPILVNEKVEFVSPSGFKFEEKDWNCFVAPISVSDLKKLYDKHKTKLFSANVRDFLGMRAKESNINFQMKKSLADSPSNFFAYNNGITILTHNIVVKKSRGKMLKVSVEGFSIVNGAQTTGTIGTSTDDPPPGAYVLARFISTNDDDLISDVVRFNNSQNSITASDFRSADQIQRRLVKEMDKIPDAEYDGGRRGGISAAIKRRPKLLPSYSVGQAIASVHGDPIVAYNEKSAIWARDSLYTKFFCDDLTATHVVFCYSLLRAVEKHKMNLIEKERIVALSADDSSKLNFYRRRGSVFLMTAAIGECLETITDKVISNRFRVHFPVPTSPDKAVHLWLPVVESLSTLTNPFDPLRDGLANSTRVKEVLSSFRQTVGSLKKGFEPIFLPIRERIVLSDP